MTTPAPTQPSHPMRRWEILALFGFGGWLVAGGWVTLAAQRWAWFMPPQLDFIAVLGWFISERWAVYLGGGLVLGLGAALCLVAAVAVVRQRAA